MNVLLLWFSLVLVILFSLMIIFLIKNYKITKEKPTVIYILVLSSLLISVFCYTIIALINRKGSYASSVAYSAYVISLILVSIADAFLVLYFHFLNGSYGILSYLYVFSFVAFLVESSHSPWEIIWVQNFGYTQKLEDIILLYLYLQLVIQLIITLFTIGSVIRNINKEMEILAESESQDSFALINNMKNKKKWLIIIILSYIFGLFLGMVSLLPGIYYLDMISLFILFIPQSMALIKDRNILKITKVNVRGVYIIADSGLILSEWVPLLRVNYHHELIGGLHNTIKRMAREIYNSSSEIHKLEFEDLVILGLEKKISIDPPANCFIITVANQSSRGIEEIIDKTLNEFIFRYNEVLVEDLEDSIFNVDHYKDFSKIIKNKFELFI